MDVSGHDVAAGLGAGPVLDAIAGVVVAGGIDPSPKDFAIVVV
jgi:hypothetical protein